MNSEYLVGQYDSGLVALSYLVACFAAWSALDLVQRIHEAHSRQMLWLSLSACAMGIGIWSMHFVGMQAFSLPIPLGYDLVKTLLSLVAAIIVAALALFVASRQNMGRGVIVAGAVLMGLGICVMHYTGMAAMEMQPGIEYDPLLFAASAVIAVAASGAALLILHNLRRIDRRWQIPARAGAAAVMGLAVVGMHYTGMAAANFPVGSLCLGSGSLTGAWTAGPVAAFTVVLAGLVMWLAGVDAAKQARERQERRQREEEERARFLAFHDPVTRLPNRTRFKQEVIGFISRSARVGRPFDLYYCVFQIPGLQDVQRIDRIACVLAERMRRLLRGNDVLCRHDRTEFILLRDRQSSADLPPKVRAQMLELCRAPLQIDNDWATLQIHIGVAEYPKDGSNSRNLLLAASRTPGAAPNPEREAERRMDLPAAAAEVRHPFAA